MNHSTIHSIRLLKQPPRSKKTKPATPKICHTEIRQRATRPSRSEDPETTYRSTSLRIQRYLILHEFMVQLFHPILMRSCDVTFVFPMARLASCFLQVCSRLSPSLKQTTTTPITQLAPQPAPTPAQLIRAGNVSTVLDNINAGTGGFECWF